ncbi:hypothetical protein OAN39_05395 [Flavobacteriaceae bacterium]|jgi:hypothetical protein|nr:hypothetical protein [Flavobacteriaceae bacterium]
MITEKQYTKLCEVSNEVLNSSDSKIERVAIPWLHIIREHPIVLAKYETLFVLKKGIGYTLKKIKENFFNRLQWWKQIYRSIRSDGQPWFGENDLSVEIDYLFISHLLNPNQFSKVEDFYYSNIPNDLINKDKSVVVASISHFSNHKAFFIKNFVKSTVPRLFFSGTLGIKKEFAIRKRLKNESSKLRVLAKNEKQTLKKRIFQESSKQVLEQGTQRTLRLEHQIKVLVSRLKPKVIIVPYEGHAFERIVFASARSVSANIKCISFQHTGVFRLSNAIRQTLSMQYNPDLILTSGIDSKLDLEKTPSLKNIPVSILGSTRGVIESIGISEEKSLKSINACLVIPEGFNSECMNLFEFSLMCAKQRPDITFVWRLHPSITFENLKKINKNFKFLPQNIILSSDSIEHDINRCSWVLYRGTTAIYKAISGGLRPFYLSIPDEISIDPLYKLKTWRIIVNTPIDIFNYINKDLNSNFKDHLDNFEMSQAVCKKQFSSINIKVLTNLV